jgi:hypothetical protein
MPRASIWSCAFALAMTVASSASAGPDPAKLKNASESFEAGAKAFKADKFEEAASHFEAADSAVPSAKALRLAIRARSEAKQYGRAATLAALAKELYASDAEAMKIADEALGKASKLHKVAISCVSPCLLAAGSHIVHGEANTRWTIYLEPGSTAVGASFTGNLTAPEQTVDAVAGGASDVTFKPPADAPPTNPPIDNNPKPKPDPIEPPDEEPKPKEDGSWGISPGFFIAGLVATAGLGGVTIWSGVDAKTNPGPDKVREECKGQGTDCPLYQEGVGKEVRTNALIGATAGTAAITLVLAIVTDWGGGDDESKAEEKPESAMQVPRLRVDVLSGREASVNGAARGENKGREDTVPTGVSLFVTGVF